MIFLALSQNSISHRFSDNVRRETICPLFSLTSRSEINGGSRAALVNVLITHQFYDYEGDGSRILGRHASAIIAGATIKQADEPAYT